MSPGVHRARAGGRRPRSPGGRPRAAPRSPALGTRSWSSSDQDTAGWASVEQELEEAAGGPVLQPAQLLDVVAHDGGLVAPGWRPASRRRWRGRPRAPGGRRTPAAGCGGPPGAPSPGPASARARRKRVGLGHGLGPELGHEADHAGEGGGEAGQVPLVAVVPAEVEVAVGAVEAGEVGPHAAVGDHRAGAVGLLDGPLDRPVEHRLVPGGQLLPARALSPMRRATAGSAIAPVGSSRAKGSLWPHQMATDGWWPRISTALRAWRTACLRTRPGVAPLQRQVLPDQHALARRPGRRARAW